ncbi:MAG: hypothetical protein MK110_01515 [Fuerstiella sp.]|nr:hypothetical protein [Fuerstiella sp.]
MAPQLTTSRASRNRRLVATSIWLCLVLTAMLLWNSRTQNTDIIDPSEPIAFLLAAFTSFVSLFAWMLFNPARGVSAETTTLMAAGAATLFPPCIIAFCAMPLGSPLSWWLTAGLFVLLVIAVMSPVPEEFFGIPRDRHSYFRQASMAGLGDQSLLELNSDWLRSTDLTIVVPESDRPSLAPSRWRDQEQLLPRSKRKRRFESAAVPDEPAVEPQPATKKVSVPDQLTGQQSTVQHDVSRTNRIPPVPYDGPGTSGVTRQSIPPTVSFKTEKQGQVGSRKNSNDVQDTDALSRTTFERVTDEFGGELIEGVVAIRFDPGQKRANVHVPFSPPLSGVPEVECDTVIDESVRVKVPERRAWGLRIEGRRTDTSAAQESDISFSAVYVPSP